MKTQNSKKQIKACSLEDMQEQLSKKLSVLDCQIVKIVHDSEVADRELKAWSQRVISAAKLLKSEQDEVAQDGITILLQQAQGYVEYYTQIVESIPEAEANIFAQQKKVKDKLESITVLAEKEAVTKRLKESNKNIQILPLPALYAGNKKENRDIDILVSQASGIIESRSVDVIP